MPFELPQSRRPVRQIQIQKRQVPLEQIIAVRGQSPVAQGIDTVGQVLGQALQRRADLRKQAQANSVIAKTLGMDVPEGTDLSQIPTQNLIQIAQTKNASDKISQYDFAGLSGDQKNMIVLNKHTGQTELKPLPEGFLSKTSPRGGAIGSGFKDESALSKEYQTNAKPYVETLQSSARALSLASQQSPTSDAALAFALTRGAMGGSGRITQTEIQQFGPQLGGYPDRVQQFLLGAATGKRYDPAIRADVIRMVNQNANEAESNLAGLEQTYKQKAQSYGFNPGRVVTNLRPTTLKNSLSPLPANGGQFVTIRASDGSMHRLPAQNIDKAKQRDPGLQVIQ